MQKDFFVDHRVFQLNDKGIRNCIGENQDIDSLVELLRSDSRFMVTDRGIYLLAPDKPQYAFAMLTSGIFESKTWETIENALDTLNVNMSKYGVIGRNVRALPKLAKGTDNLIVYDVGRSAKEYNKLGSNILFIRDGFLGNRFSFSVDVCGFREESSVVVNSEYSIKPSKDEIENLHSDMKKHGLSFNSYDPDGHILMVVTKDNIQPLINTAIDINSNNVPVVVVPDFNSELWWNKTGKKYKAQFDSLGWQFVKYEDADLAELTINSSAILTNGADGVMFGLYTGTPILSTKRGIFSDSNTVIEQRIPLDTLINHKMDQGRVIGLLCAVQRHHLSYSENISAISDNIQLSKWCSSIHPHLKLKDVLKHRLIQDLESSISESDDAEVIYDRKAAVALLKNLKSGDGVVDEIRVQVKGLIRSLSFKRAGKLRDEYLSPAEQFANSKYLPITLMMTCHEKYLCYLEDAIDSVDSQDYEFEQKIITLDDCEVPDWLCRRADWTVIGGKWGKPNPQRNLAIKKAQTPWILYMDADNLMPEGYCAHVKSMLFHVEGNVSFLYSNIQYCDSQMKHTQLWKVPEYDFWKLRKGNYVDTFAIFRKSALEEIDGWDDESPTLDDYNLVLRLTRAGWKGQKLHGPAYLYRRHEEGRCLSGKIGDKERIAMWNAKTFCIVTLLAGRMEPFERWSNWLMTENIPPKCSLMLVDNSNSEEYHNMISDWCRKNKVADRFERLTISRISKPCTVVPGTHEMELIRHLHVAKLYNHAIMSLTDDLIVTCEDDVIPYKGAIWDLMKPFKPWGRIGACAAVYPSAGNPKAVTAAAAYDYWHKTILFEDLKEEIIEVGFVGGGLTVWENFALKKCMPFKAKLREGRLDGWDSNMCRDIRDSNLKILLHGGVRCEHLCGKR